MRRTRQLTTRPLSRLDKMWYRRLGVSEPDLVSPAGLGALVRLIPYQWRRVHHCFATSLGYFWKPCPLCGREFGGHEYGTDIPNLSLGPRSGQVICSECTKNRVGMIDT